MTRRRFLTASLAPFVVAACGGSPGSSAVPPPVGRYTTTFAGTENPLSEDGAWSHRGWNWTRVQKKGGLAYGTQTGYGGYDDSYAYLSGFASDHQGEAVVHVSPTLTGSPHEAEILLRWADSAFSARGYECLFSFDGNLQIVRWNGAFGDFTNIGSDTGSLGRPLVTGDVLRARAAGRVITCYINDVLLARATDPTWRDGQPGIGFFKRVSGANPDLAFSRFVAASVYGSEFDSRRTNGDIGGRAR